MRHCSGCRNLKSTAQDFTPVAKRSQPSLHYNLSTAPQAEKGRHGYTAMMSCILLLQGKNVKNYTLPIYYTQATLSETTFCHCDSIPSPRTWRPEDAAYSVPLLFTALCKSTRSDGRFIMDLNKYFLLGRFPRKVVNSISNIPATVRRHNSHLKPTERIKPIRNLTQRVQQYHSEPEKSINLNTSALQRRGHKT